MNIVKALISAVEFFGFLFVYLTVGSWWLTNFSQGGEEVLLAAFYKSTTWLVFSFVGYFKFIYEPRFYHSRFKFCFYTFLAFCASLSYVYGIFHWFF